jgi:hypothetical protein
MAEGAEDERIGPAPGAAQFHREMRRDGAFSEGTMLGILGYGASP